MNKYKVFGDKVVDYYINVEATSAEEAWDIASNAATTDWIQMETDNTIQVHFVDNELEEDTSNLLEDGYPNINNDIIISDKSDIQDCAVCNGHTDMVTGYLQIPWNLIKYNTIIERIDNNGNKA